MPVKQLVQQLPENKQRDDEAQRRRQRKLPLG